MINKPIWGLKGALLFSQASLLLLATAAQGQESTEPTALKPTVVTGTYLESQDAAGTLNVSVMDMEEPVNVGRATLADTLRTRAPQYAGGTGVVNPGFGNGGDGSSQISLRGLPANATLLLVNGRRTVSGDLNMIPEAAIERVEILNDGGSSIYGSDAVAGVVNVILKEDYDGAKFGTYYANTTDTDVGQFKASALLGTRTEKSKFVVSVEYDKANSLMTRDRDVSLNAPGSTSLTSNPGLFWNNAPGAGFTAIRWTLVPENTRGLTSASQVPAGFDPNAKIALTGTSAEKSAQLTAEVARLNALLPANSPVRYAEVSPGSTTQLPVPAVAGYGNGFPFLFYTTGYRPHEKYSVYSSASQQLFGENLEFYANGFYTKNSSELNLAPSPLSGTRYVVPTGNYWYQNVFGESASAPLRFSYRPLEVGPRITYTDFQTANFIAGLKGRIGESTWHWDTSFLYDRYQVDETQTGGVKFDAFAPALADGSPSAYNPFGYTPLFGKSEVNSEDLWNSLLGKGFTKGVYQLLSWQAKVNGGIFDLPGGKLMGVVGTEYRREKTDYEPDYALTQGLIGPYNAQQELHAIRDSMAGFGEIVVPIFGEDFKLPALNKLIFTAAVRYEDYSDVGDTGVKPRFSFSWEPIDEQFTIRGSYAEGFIAPGFFDLYQEPGQDFIEVYNPLTGLREQPENAAFTIGNPALKPIDAETWMIGGTAKPKFIKGFSMGVDYYKITQTGIPFASAQYIVNQWAAAGGNDNPDNPYGTAAPKSAANPLGAQVDTLDGVITEIRNVGPINTGERLTDGIDVNVSQRFETEIGNFIVDGMATRILTFEQEDFPGAGSIDYLGRFWGPGAVLDNTGFPEWRATIGLTYEYKRVTAAVAWNYVSGYEEDANAVDFVGADSAPRDVEDYNTFDVRLGFKLPWAEADLMVGVNNVFDEQPPMVISSFENNYDRRVADLRGRMYFVSLSKKF